jgi:hypothetical protein
MKVSQLQDKLPITARHNHSKVINPNKEAHKHNKASKLMVGITQFLQMVSLQEQR